MLASIGELHTRADHELLDGGGNDDLAGPRERSDTSADVNGQAAEVLSDRLALACMDAGPQLDAQLRDPVTQRLSAAHRHSRPIKRRQRIIADVLDHPPAVLWYDTVYELVVALEDLAPCAIAQLRCARRRGHYVREQDACQHPVRRGELDRARDEPLDLIDDGVQVAKPEVMVVAGVCD